MIIIVDFGGQTTHLISRRIKELGVNSEIVIPEKAIEKVKELNPKGLIFSGGPAFVNEENSPTVDKKIFDFKIPILGICYGQQVVAHLLGGKVAGGKIKEFGPAFVKTTAGKPALLFNHIPDRFRVWMSHGDSVVELPKGFRYIATTEDIKGGAIADEVKNIYCVQFHPEVTHTEYGQEILKNFLNICGEKPEKEEIDINSIIKNIKETVGDKKVIMALSGGTDSFVAAALIAKAIGNQLIPVHVESGLMRDDALKNVEETFAKTIKIKPKIIKAQSLFLK
ncbi:MAG: glutamine-hydrolyzing GMP synthase [Candidatus Roizmanbacteria bacterium]|nr:glutamine-hydrolyzing GMP synthase [Candidatus Roizmanbacteria bacterium]